MKILVIRFSSIGDIVLTTPVVRCLKLQLANAKIHFATKKQYAEIVTANPHIDKVYCLENSISDLIQMLKAEQYDYVIDLHNNQRSFLLKWKLGVPSFSFDKLNWQKWLMVNLKINQLPSSSIVERYVATTSRLSLHNDHEGLDYFIATKDIINIEELPTSHRHGFVAWVIGAKQNTKKFPLQKIVSTLKLMSNTPIVLFGGPEDKIDGQTIMSTLPNHPIYNAAGKYSLAQSASLLQKASVVVTNDTGLMHIAAALKKPIISIWGNTIPEFGMFPYYGKHEVPQLVIQIADLKCRPCSKIGYKNCPEGHFDCMNKVEEEQIADTILKMFASKI